jgi:gliding motility-associated-like protein
MQTNMLSDVTAAAAGTYQVSVVLNGCVSAGASTVVVVNPRPVITGTISNNSPLCEGETLTLTAPNLAGVNYQWTGPNGFSSTAQNINISNVREGDHQGFYNLVVTNPTTGCSSDPLSTLVFINNLPPAGLALNNGPLCAAETAQLTVPTVFGATYSWTGPNGFSSTVQNPTLPNITTTQAGTYTVEVTAGGCTTSLTTDLVVRSLPNATVMPDTTIREGDALQLYATGGVLFRWAPFTYLDNANSPTPIFSGAPQGAYTYSVFVSNAEGCTVEKKVDITVLPGASDATLRIVDLFTPNGDGVNDTWEISGLLQVPSYNLMVVSRGGLVVLNTDDYRNDWDGTAPNGKKLPDGTYWYILRTNDRTYTGAVTIKR